MKTYLINGLAGSASAIVGGLHKGSRAPAKNDHAWMVEAAGRIKMLTGHAVRSDSAENFLDDVIKLELLDSIVEK